MAETYYFEIGTPMGPDQPTIRFSRYHEDANMPSYAMPGDAGMDLSVIDKFTFTPEQRIHIFETGLSVAVPNGYVGLVTPRSSLPSKKQITVSNSPGIIDSGYRGPLHIIAHWFGDGAWQSIEAGERIAQFVVVPFAHCPIQEVDDVAKEQTERGVGGIGSTGI